MPERATPRVRWSEESAEAVVAEEDRGKGPNMEESEARFSLGSGHATEVQATGATFRGVG